MKKHTAKMCTSAVLITLFLLAGCTGKNNMGMDEMNKDTMKAEMKTDSAMKKMDSNMDDMSHKKMNTDMSKKMPEKVESTMTDTMDSMKNEMDESMKSDTQKME